MVKASLPSKTWRKKNSIVVGITPDEWQRLHANGTLNPIMFEFPAEMALAWDGNLILLTGKDDLELVSRMPEAAESVTFDFVPEPEKVGGLD